MYIIYNRRQLADSSVREIKHLLARAIITSAQVMWVHARSQEVNCHLLITSFPLLITLYIFHCIFVSKLWRFSFKSQRYFARSRTVKWRWLKAYDFKQNCFWNADKIKCPQYSLWYNKSRVTHILQDLLSEPGHSSGSTVKLRITVPPFVTLGQVHSINFAIHEFHANL